MLSSILVTLRERVYVHPARLPRVADLERNTGASVSTTPMLSDALN